jgi:type IV secretory pathway VirB10-like protein
MPDPTLVRRISVGRTARRTIAAPLALGLLLVGTIVFAKMAENRNNNSESALGLPPLKSSMLTAPVSPLAPVGTATAAPVRLVLSSNSAVMAPMPQLAAASLGFARPAAHPAPYPVRSEQSSTGGPALILDLFSGRSAHPATNTAGMAQEGESGPIGIRGPDPTGAAIAAAGPAVEAEVARDAAQQRGGTDNERFSDRVNNRKPADAVQAQRMSDLDRLVPQGAVVGAVLETALNSDLPGYARAVVTKDVLSFDGSAVLIPAGSRVVGEYNSGVAQGASRIFIVWTRLIRPDGVTIALGSPATDELGRAGLAGKVNRHFLQRFSGAILLSVLTGAINAGSSALARGSTIFVGTGNEATTLATQALRGNDIPPTIKTRQGALVRIFVARDLDFSAVGPARQ